MYVLYLVAWYDNKFESNHEYIFKLTCFHVVYIKNKEACLNVLMFDLVTLYNSL